MTLKIFQSILCFVIFTNQMFGLYQTSFIQKPLKDFCLSMYLYIITMYVTCVHTPGIADVQKPGRVHMGHARPKINDMAVVY